MPRSVLVDVDGNGDFHTIQAAIDASLAGDTILLSNGRFRGDGNRDLTFYGRNLVIRSMSGNPTFCIIDCDGTMEQPHRGATFSSGEGRDFVIEGITIEDGYVPGGGGGILCEEGSAPTLRNVTFQSHRMVALACFGASASVVDCTFRRNLDGAVFVSSADLSVALTVFVDNYADYGGGAIRVRESRLTLVSSEFVRNAAGFAGGGLYVDDISQTASSEVVATDCLFFDNVAGYYGGGAYFAGTEFQLMKCCFAGNTSGVRGGALNCTALSSGSIEGGVFHDNQSNVGEAVSCGNSAASLKEVIIFQNQGGAAVTCNSSAGPTVLTFQCSDIFGNSEGDWTECIADQLGANGNIAANPLFCDPPNRDFRLQSTSPCAPGGDCGLIGGTALGCEHGSLPGLEAQEK